MQEDSSVGRYYALPSSAAGAAAPVSGDWLLRKTDELQVGFLTTDTTPNIGLSWLSYLDLLSTIRRHQHSIAEGAKDTPLETKFTEVSTTVHRMVAEDFTFAKEMYQHTQFAEKEPLPPAASAGAGAGGAIPAAPSRDPLFHVDDVNQYLTADFQVAGGFTEVSVAPDATGESFAHSDVFSAADTTGAAYTADASLAELTQAITGDY